MLFLMRKHKILCPKHANSYSHECSLGLWSPLHQKKKKKASKEILKIEDTGKNSTQTLTVLKEAGFMF